MGKYDSKCQEMYFRPDNPPRPGRVGCWVYGQEFKGQAYAEDTPFVLEMMPLIGNYSMMGGFPKEIPSRRFTMFDHQGGPFPKIHDADKVIFFVGSDPENPNDLGGHVTMFMGTEDEEDIFEFDEPCAIYVPAGTQFGPIYVTDVRRNIFYFDIFATPSKGDLLKINKWDFVPTGKKEELLYKVIGDNMDAYKVFFSANPEYEATDDMEKYRFKEEQ